MISEFNHFMSALMCFVGELIFFGVVVTLFVFMHLRHAWNITANLARNPK